jgi:hypothetical protein
MIHKKYILMLLILPAFLYAQDRDYSKELGYVDFGDLTQFEKDDNITEVYLDESLLGMVSKMSKDEDSEMIGNLKLIKVNVFHVDEANRKGIQNKINDIDKMLMSRKWNRIVRSKTKDETANVYIMQDANKKVAGLVVTTIGKDGEAAFINIVGQIDLESMGNLGSKFNIPSLGDNHKTKPGS